jgi:hypothetical protein
METGFAITIMLTQKLELPFLFPSKRIALSNRACSPDMAPVR